MNIEWRDINGYEGLYQISSDGRVKSVGRTVLRGNTLMRISERILKPSIAKNGYYIVNLNNNGCQTKYIHRLIAEAFIENPRNLPCVEHINADKLDCSLGNLRWCSYEENNRNPITRARMSEGSKGFKPTEKHIERIRESASKKVCQISADGERREWKSVADASRSLGICVQTIYRCCNHPQTRENSRGI